MTDKQTIDYSILITVMMLISIGMIIVYSASSPWGANDYGDPNFWIKRHAVRVGLGLIMMAVFWRIDYRKLRSGAKWALLAGFGLLLYLVISHDVLKIKGAQRWIEIFGYRFQPSEIMKFALILYVADVMDRKRDQLHDLMHGYLPMLIIVGLAMIFILIQPDLGTTCVIFAIVTTMFLAGRVRFLHLIGTILAALPLAYITVLRNPYQMRRILIFMNPDVDPQGKGYQIKQSLISLGNGGLFGQGLGQSKQKLLYLPDPYTDFIFSILGEEFGFIGAVVVLALFVWFLWRGLSVAANAPDFFGMLLATGITGAVAIAALINIAVTCSMLPTKGLPLPFISYGGTSLLLSLSAVGVLLNISRHAAPANDRQPPNVRIS